MPPGPALHPSPAYAGTGGRPDRIAQVIETRVRRPGQIAEAAADRARAASVVGPDGRLVIVAADHPARGTLRAGRRRSAMADRADLL
jgi:hypothetical protein